MFSRRHFLKHLLGVAALLSCSTFGYSLSLLQGGTVPPSRVETAPGWKRPAQGQIIVPGQD